MARALDFFTKESLVSVKTVRQVPKVTLTAVQFQHGHLFKVYLLSSSNPEGGFTSHKKRFEIRVARAENFGFKLHAKVNSFFGNGNKEDEDSLTDLGSELDKNGNEMQKGAKRTRTNSIKTEPEPVECVNCRILREEKRNADNEIIRREKDLFSNLVKDLNMIAF